MIVARTVFRLSWLQRTIECAVQAHFIKVIPTNGIKRVSG